MAKEFKQRKIRNGNKKYIKLSIIIISIIIVLTLIITIIAKCSKTNKIKVDTNENIQNNISMNINATNTNIESDSKSNLKIMPSENIIKNVETKVNTVNTTNNILENKSNTTESTIGKNFTKADAVIGGIQREMTMEEVEKIKGRPVNVATEHEIATEYTVQKCYYDDGKTQVDFIALYEKNKLIVHRIKTTNPGEILSRGLKIGSTVGEVIAAYSAESILYKDDSLIVIGFTGEDPRYATSIKPKLYFDIEKGKITSVSVNIGSEM